MKTSTILSAATLLSTSSAATVSLETTRCLDPSYPLVPFSIELGTSAPVPVDLPTVCGTRIVSVSDGVDVHTIQCQAFRDAQGTQPGSAVFTYDDPALIATNPVQEGAVQCSVVSTYPTAALDRRQANFTPPVTPSFSVPVLRSTVLQTSLVTPTGSAAGTASGSAASTSIQTVVVIASSGMPTPSANSTVLSTTPQPSASSTASSAVTQSTGAADALGLSVGAVAGAFAALLL